VFATALAFRLRIIAAAVIGAVAGADHRTYLVEDMQKADDDVSLTFDDGHATQGLDPEAGGNKNSLRDLLIVQHRR
jgi:hypothetical protein